MKQKMITKGIEPALKHIILETIYLSKEPTITEGEIIKNAYDKLEPLIEAEANNRVLESRKTRIKPITVDVVAMLEDSQLSANEG